MAFMCLVREQILAPPEAVFAAATDFPNAPQRIRGIKKMEMLTQGPVGVGTKFRETRVMFGQEAALTMEVVEFQQGRSYTLRAIDSGCEYRTTVSVRPAASGSEVTFDFSGKGLTVGRRVMSALMGWMMKRACAKTIGQDLADLKAAVEKATAD